MSIEYVARILAVGGLAVAVASGFAMMVWLIAEIRADFDSPRLSTLFYGSAITACTGILTSVLGFVLHLAGVML